MISWMIIDPDFLPDVELVAEYRALQDGLDEHRKVALAAEIERRGLEG
jgi:hypothetical protein